MDLDDRHVAGSGLASGSRLLVLPAIDLRHGKHAARTGAGPCTGPRGAETKGAACSAAPTIRPFAAIVKSLPSRKRRALPISMHPLLILLPSAALLGLAVSLTAGSFKKYL